MRRDWTELARVARQTGRANSEKAGVRQKEKERKPRESGSETEGEGEQTKETKHKEQPSIQTNV